jgi:hypothetical protein
MTEDRVSKTLSDEWAWIGPNMVHSGTPFKRVEEILRGSDTKHTGMKRLKLEFQKNLDKDLLTLVLARVHIPGRAN